MRTTEPPSVVEGGDVFEVEHILGKRMSRKKTQYLVKWFGYGDEHNVWYNEEDLSEAQEAVKDYEFWLTTHPHPQTESRKKSNHDQDNATTPRHLHPIPPKPRDSTSSTQAIASSSSSSPKPFFDLALTPWADRLQPRR